MIRIEIEYLTRTPVRIISHSEISLRFANVGMAAKIQSPRWLWGQVLLLPDVSSCSFHGLETVFP